MLIRPGTELSPDRVHDRASRQARAGLQVAGEEIGVTLIRMLRLVPAGEDSKRGIAFDRRQPLGADRVAG